MRQETLNDPTHSPDCDPIPVSSNSTGKGDDITKTGGLS